MDNNFPRIHVERWEIYWVNHDFCSIFNQPLIVYDGKQQKNFLDHNDIIISWKDYALCSNPQLKASDNLIYNKVMI